MIHRVPSSEELPTQRDIYIFFCWALVAIGALSLAYTILLRSVAPDADAATAFCAFAFAWVVGFVAVPIPAGVGIREALLVALIPGVGTAPVLAASLALRLLTIATEVLTLFVNKLVMRLHNVVPPSSVPSEELARP